MMRPSPGVVSVCRVQSRLTEVIAAPICHTSIQSSTNAALRMKTSIFPCLTRLLPSPSTLPFHSILLVVRSKATREDFWAGYSALVDSGMLAYSVAPSHNSSPLPLDNVSAGQSMRPSSFPLAPSRTVSYTHLRAHETRHDLVCRLLPEKKTRK